MAIFDATISVQQNPSGGCWLEIQDVSNYGNDQNLTHDVSMFDTYFKVIVDRPYGNDYVFSSLPGYDSLVNPPDTNIFSGIYNFDPSDINGTYTVNLISVPTFQNGQTYSNVDSDVVYYNGELWAATTAGVVSIPVIGNTDWLAIDDTYLLANFTKYTGSVSVVISCISPANFLASLTEISGENTIEVLDGCSGLSIGDMSNYSANNNPGHALSNFMDYIRIVITNQTGNMYVMQSVPGDDVDEMISAPSVGTSIYNYLFQEDIDKDGIYTITMCTYPTWDVSVPYVTSPLNVVYYNGVLYRAINGSTGSQPDLSPLDWEVYEPTTEEELLTRYCTEQKVVVLCIDINECRERLVHKAFCEIDNDFCNDDILCKNRDFLNGTKIIVILAEMEYSVSNHAWNEVEKQMNLLRTICNCG